MKNYRQLWSEYVRILETIDHLDKAKELAMKEAAHILSEVHAALVEGVRAGRANDPIGPLTNVGVDARFPQKQEPLPLRDLGPRINPSEKS